MDSPMRIGRVATQPGLNRNVPRDARGHSITTVEPSRKRPISAPCCSCSGSASQLRTLASATPRLASSPIGPAKVRPLGSVALDVLRGRWVRPDGGYGVVIRSVGADGQLEAMYFNPKGLPFSKAQASRDGQTLRVFLELQAGGYNGSTYELSYDPATDRLKGVYFQAVAKQRYEIYFERQKP